MTPADVSPTLRVPRHGYAEPSQAKSAISARQVDVPRSVRELATLPRVDYADAFVVEIGPVAHDRTAEQWARAMLGEAPATMRRGLRRGWQSLGLRLRGPGSLLGWELRRSTPDHVLLGAESWLGPRAELVLERRERALLLATLVRKGGPLGWVLWAGIEPLHVRVVPSVLEQRARSICDGS